MATRVDLNADMGESFGPWVMGHDAELLNTITSANIACGFHAGDPDVMAHTMALALKNGVGLGCHPGFDDLRGFGRRRLNMSAAELTNMLTYQLGASQAMARAAGGEIRHFKLHGALSNMCSENKEMALICYRAARAIAPELRIMVLVETAQQEAVRELGAPWVGEIFADRAYNDDATLVDRALPGAVIHDATMAGPRIAEMVREGAIITQSGKRIPARIDTICLHGDTPEAVDLAASVRTSLEADGVSVRQFD
ncbi:5-oxoprolinase subunit PxpA [Primorskyibacter aestuariivivens]|uniref:LamB/YcsF family protein n=1 Tax=Primorskyibacter aestuariivivens TaxID=1888912 RepID=UPI00230004D0|nr:5-oxoprolinase subunit PxpA [Primorskyibacter aestuariivivens]MDA7427876.1 5-oxoprolinase subunit PxpA [Primorskyibacter aestuariivivens]